MRSTLSTDTQIYPDPIVAAYNDGGGDNVTTVLIDQAMSDLSASNQSQLTASGSAADVVSETMTGAGVSDAQTEGTNANTGALSCGTKQESGSTVTICVWYDQTTFGTLQYLDGTSPSSAAPIADAVRAAAEVLSDSALLTPAPLMMLETTSAAVPPEVKSLWSLALRPDIGWSTSIVVTSSPPASLYAASSGFG